MQFSIDTFQIKNYDVKIIQLPCTWNLLKWIPELISFDVTNEQHYTLTKEDRDRNFVLRMQEEEKHTSKIDPKMKIGFSFSPGGFLFTYHLGVLSSLMKEGYIDDHTSLAGASAGSIAVVAFVLGKTEEAINCAIDISDKCTNDLGGQARGRLLPLLEEAMDRMLPQDTHEIIRKRPGFTGVSFTQIFPVKKSVLQSEFESREALMEAVCNSSMFPFFTSNKFFLVRPSKKEMERRRSSFVGSDTSSKNGEDQEGKQDENRIRSSNDTNVSSLDKDEQYSSDSSYDIFSTKEIGDDYQQQQQQPKIIRMASNLRSSFHKKLSDITDSLPRLVLDGYVSWPRNRFGCPVFPLTLDDENDTTYEKKERKEYHPVDRTVTICCFPSKVVGLTASEPCDLICPSHVTALFDSSAYDNIDNKSQQRFKSDLELFRHLIEVATKPSSSERHYQMFELGKQDADRWIDAEREREHNNMKTQEKSASESSQKNVSSETTSNGWVLTEQV